MGPKGAVEIIFRKDLGDPQKIAARTEEYRQKFANPFVAGQPRLHRRRDHAARDAPAHLPVARDAAREAAREPVAQARQHSAVAKAEARRAKGAAQTAPLPAPRLRHTMFKKILIANRGEIACRVIRTARRMGIRTVAVYSEADRDALHVTRADEAVPIGPPPSAQSYLRHRRDHRRRARRPAPRRCIRATASCPRTRRSPTRWRRPASSSSARSVEAIAGMGDKIASKKLAATARVNTIPGYTDVIRDADAGGRDRAEDRLSGDDQGARRRRRQGPAGRAHRRRGPRGVRELPATRRKAAFGDDRVFIEKFIEEPRHIEIQVLGDAHGNVRLPLGARVLDPAPPPEGDRGGALAVPRRARRATRWASRPSRSPRR